MIDLHVCLDEKITCGDIHYIRHYFPVESNPIFIFGHDWGFDYSGIVNLVQVNKDFSGLKKLATAMKKADRIHLHGLFAINEVILLALRKDLASKCNWIIWGDDLYTLTRIKKTISGKLHNLVRKQAVQNFYSVATNVSGDWKVLERLLNKKVRFFEMGFTAGSLGNVQIKSMPWSAEKPVSILLGNSATRTNCHADALERMAHLRNSNIRIYAPLSYGDATYGDLVEAKGKELFGDKFIALRKFMPADEYFRLLGDIDVAVMAHDRQQAMGNIVPLIYAGKRVYLRRDITTWDCLKDQHGLEIYPYEDISCATIEQLATGISDIAVQRAKCEKMANDDTALELYRKMLCSEQDENNKQRKCI